MESSGAVSTAIHVQNLIADRAAIQFLDAAFANIPYKNSAVLGKGGGYPVDTFAHRPSRQAKHGENPFFGKTLFSLEKGFPHVTARPKLIFVSVDDDRLTEKFFITESEQSFVIGHDLAVSRVGKIYHCIGVS